MTKEMHSIMSLVFAGVMIGALFSSSTTLVAFAGICMLGESITITKLEILEALGKR